MLLIWTHAVKSATVWAGDSLWERYPNRSSRLRRCFGVVGPNAQDRCRPASPPLSCEPIHASRDSSMLRVVDLSGNHWNRFVSSVEMVRRVERCSREASRSEEALGAVSVRAVPPPRIRAMPPTTRLACRPGAVPAPEAWPSSALGIKTKGIAMQAITRRARRTPAAAGSRGRIAPLPVQPRDAVRSPGSQGRARREEGPRPVELRPDQPRAAGQADVRGDDGQGQGRQGGRHGPAEEAARGALRPVRQGQRQGQDVARQADPRRAGDQAAGGDDVG